MARARERVSAIIVAVLFLLSSLGGTIFLIYQMVQDNKSSDQNQQTSSKSKLEGTKLQNFTPVGKVDKLQIIDITPGTGAVVQASDTITADYTGALAATGTIFQSSLDGGQPFTSPLSGLIKGWQDGIPGMKVGGTRRLLIPAADAYGAQEQPGIPANSDLVFDITVHSVQSK